MRLVVSILFVMPLVAQQQAPKNLKILQPDQVMATMQTFTTGLGVRCNFCHVQGDFAADTNHHKVTAREMYTMTEEINKHFPGGAKVACYTCHRGAEQPLMTPPAGSAPPGR
jgi:photosynthetic reaction center cytochrome c subunit